MDNTDTPFTKIISLRWSDLDPNFHLRHSAYYDLCAQQRIEVLYVLGLTLQVMQEQHFGPVLFREECVFKREIRLSDQVFLTARLARLTADGSRWTIRHEFTGSHGKIMALLTVEGAWIDTALRKIASPTPPIVLQVFDAIPRAEGFIAG